MHHESHAANAVGEVGNRLSEPRAPRGESLLDLPAVRARLAADHGPALWRSLEELAETPEFTAMLHREFPARASEWAEGDGQSRRQFLKLMAASLALAGVGGTAGCTRQPRETILPYVNQPEMLVPGIPQRYATAMPHFGGFARGVLAESHEGRPTKIEGNPEHPSNPLGATDVFMQASVLDLYDPDRAQTVLHAGEGSSWDFFLADLVPLLLAQTAKAGAGLRVLTETVVSPTLGSQLEALLKKFPQARWHQWEPVGRDHVREGARLAFGEIVETRHDFSKAKVVVSLDGDFLFAHPDSLRYARDFTDARRVRLDVPGSDPNAVPFNRLYVAEPSPTITGAMADHRLPVAASEVEGLARALLARLVPAADPVSAPSTGGAWLDAVAGDLAANRGAGVVIVGERQPAAVHALVHALNAALGNAGTTVTYAPSAEVRPENHAESLRTLAVDLHAGSVDLLLILGGNPVYSAPADLGFADALGKAGRRVHFGPRYDETSQLCHWHLPEAHFLETWGDGRAFDGTASIQQPLIEPLYPDARGAAQAIDYFLQSPVRTAYDLVRDYWRGQRRELDDTAFDKWWRRSVHDGFIAGSALPPPAAMPPAPAIAADVPAIPNFESQISNSLELAFAPDPTVWDGRFANNAWLQEIPKPITKLTWDNAAFISPRLAERLGLTNEDVVELTLAGRSLHAPVWLTPGQAENSVTLSLGYGRRLAGNVGNGQGVDAYALRTTAGPGFARGLVIKKVSGAHWTLATTQTHHGLHGRGEETFRSSTLAEFRARPALVEHDKAPGPADTLYPPDHTYPGHAWGMVIDLNTCLGCNACTIACQAENNIPVVGKGEVARQREMHWIRVDSYYEGKDLDNPQFGHQPVPCMHCENAPCEVVCPVEATLHSPEGLNEQVYNRCIGTRYCSNNCPYKVRRFNFLQWADNTTLQYKLQRNPDVTVRSRGVMEKCTYCVQRIQEVKINAQRENDRPIKDGEILTACQQACPTAAIIFGDLNDQSSRVARLRAQPHNFGMLAELGTRPRTTYLTKLRNPAS